MSWDVYIQDLPDGVRFASEIPDDFKPRPLGPREGIIEKLRRAAPDFRFTDATCGVIEFSGGSIDVDVGDEDPCECVALFIRGGDEAVERVIAIVEALGGRALDTGNDGGIFDAASAHESMAAWRKYRDQVVGDPRDGQRVKRKPWWKFW